jgi:hypothetical protein
VAAQAAPATTGLSHAGFGDETVRVALRRSGAQTVPGSSRRVTFGGKDTVTIPAGEREYSDAVKLSVGAQRDLAVSIFVRGTTARPPGIRTRSPPAITPPPVILHRR